MSQRTGLASRAPPLNTALGPKVEGPGIEIKTERDLQAFGRTFLVLGIGASTKTLSTIVGTSSMAYNQRFRRRWASL